MPDPTQLPFLLKLIDDGSAFVRKKVMEELKSFGTPLEAMLERLAEPPQPFQRNILKEIFLQNRKRIFHAKWVEWLRKDDGKAKLEEGFSHLADYFNGASYPVKLKTLLDQYTSEYNSMHDSPDVLTLARFMFETKGLKGAEMDYYNPRNSDLVYVIQTRRGLPISLACIFILVGCRLGIQIDGCNIPGHFFAQVNIKGQKFLVDCFNGGQFFLAEDFQPFQVSTDFSTKNAISSPPTSEIIFRRVLMNITHALQKEDDRKEVDFFLQLLTMLNKKK